MKAIVVTDQAAGTAGMKLVEWPDPRAAINDAVDLGRSPRPYPDTDRSLGTSWPGWLPPWATARRGSRWDSAMFGLGDWYRDGTLAEYAAVEARDLAPMPGDVDLTVGASLPISGLTGCSSFL
jgi:hypothetical protein